jgi:NTP pyrophosphatase (non-canonical NTP hydrolase)
MINENHKHRNETEKLLLKSLKISEEVWEFHNEILWQVWFSRIWKEHSREELEKECADVILSTLMVADDLWIDIEKILDKKLKIAFERFNLKYE